MWPPLHRSTALQRAPHQIEIHPQNLSCVLNWVVPCRFPLKPTQKVGYRASERREKGAWGLCPDSALMTGAGGANAEGHHRADTQGPDGSEETISRAHRFVGDLTRPPVFCVHDANATRKKRALLATRATFHFCGGGYPPAPRPAPIFLLGLLVKRRNFGAHGLSLRPQLLPCSPRLNVVLG